MSASYIHILQQNVVFASRAATLACRPSYSTVLLLYYFAISLHIQYCRGRCLGLAARDAKKCLHRGQPLLDVGLVLPRTTTYHHVLLYVLPRTTTYYHVLPRTTTYCHILPRTTTYYRALPRTTTYYQVLTHTTHVLPRTIVQAERSFCISGSHLACRPSRSTFYYLLFHFTPHTVLPRPMFGVGGPRCKKNLHRGQPLLDVGLVLHTTTYYHVLPHTTTHVLPRTIVQAERSFCISDSQPQTSAAKFLHLGLPVLHVASVFACRPNASPGMMPTSAMQLISD